MTDGKSFLQCPQCKKYYGQKTGNQPLNGTMHHHIDDSSLPGYHGYKTIVIHYSFHGGMQGPEHPHPGRPYRLVGFPRIAYLPDNVKGRKVLRLLKEAFDRRLIFTVG
jgi:deltex-like protein